MRRVIRWILRRVVYDRAYRAGFDDGLTHGFAEATRRSWRGNVYYVRGAA